MRKGVAVALVAVLAVLGLLVPLPFLVVIAPGSAVSVGERIDLGQPADELSGHLLLTTVRVFPPSALGAARAWLDEHQDVLSRDMVVPEGVDTEEYEEAQRELFRESSEVAAAVGLRAAGEEVEVSGGGARVAQVIADSPAADALHAGDVVVAVDGRPIELASDLVVALAERPPGEEVLLTVDREGEDEAVVVPVELRVVEELGRPALGVAVTTVDLDISLPFPVEVDQGGIGGPSAGLMIALTVYDLADPGDLVKGRTIAGTGTIDLGGDVGAVGGVDAKVVAARQAGATLFLVPDDEAALAQEVAGDDLEVVPVDTLEEAIAVLQSTA